MGGHTLSFMQFDIFHSIGRIDSVKPTPSDGTVFREFLRQCREGEAMGYQTMWVAESHFSSEVQKHHKHPVIPNYHGEVGLNADSCQLAQLIFRETKQLGFGTAIFNIVGGNGGPIGAADRIRTLAFLNQLSPNPRKLHIGVAAGRFPYINAPFGITPRNAYETLLWPQIQRVIFLEALEIFLRLSHGETISSNDVTPWVIDERFFRSKEEFESTRSRINSEIGTQDRLDYPKRWNFEPIKLVPDVSEAKVSESVRYVLGSHDPLARDLALKYADIDVFNLSFTPPDQLNKIHQEMFARYERAGRSWNRGRLPRTVLVFIDEKVEVAQKRAEECFDTYIEAMRGTVVLPPKSDLMERALIGSPEMILDQLHPENIQKGFHPEDRLMLWFEFNQVDHDGILKQMKLFSERVMSQATTFQSSKKL